MLLGAAGAFAQGVRATVDRVEATVEDQLVLTVTVEGSQSAQPQLPELPEFDVFPRGQSQQVNWINGRLSASASHNYALVPRRAGTFSIGQVKVEIDGETYASQPFRVRILSAASQPAESRDIFVTAEVSNTRPFLGQQVIYTWRFYRRVRLDEARLEPQEFDGFLVEELGEAREYEATVRGQQFLVSEMRLALFPQEEGALVVPPSALTVGVLMRSSGRSRTLFDDFFGRVASQKKVLRTRPIELEVRPLPPAPHDFSGLVGKFALGAEATKKELKVGESTTVKVTVSGAGNVQHIREPMIPDLGAFKVYDDKPSERIDRSAGFLRGSKTFSKALVPLEAGQLDIPAFRLVYFDPEAETYLTASTSAIALEVHPADGQEELRLTEVVSPESGKVTVKILADDILPIHKGLETAARPPLSELGSTLWVGGLAVPPLAFLGLMFARRRQERFEMNAHLRRSRGALKRACKTLRRVRSLASEGRRGEAAQIAYRCLREYVGDKLGLEGSALTAAEADAVLRRRGVDEDLVRRTHSLLDRLEAARYAPHNEKDGAVTAEALRPLLKELERQIR